MNGSAARLVDLMPTVLRTMGIPLMAPVDGRAYKLPLSAVSQRLASQTRHGRKGRGREAPPAPSAWRGVASGARRGGGAAGRRRQSPRPPAPAPAVRPSDESSFWMLSLMASAVSCTAAFSG